MITLKTLPQATEQEIFDQVTTHLLTQKVRAQDPKTGRCVYRGANGTKCAAGCLIGDDELDFNVCNQDSWDDLTSAEVAPKNYRDLINMLQIIHDRTHPEQWRDKLKDLAEKRKLTFNPPPDENSNTIN